MPEDDVDPPEDFSTDEWIWEASDASAPVFEPRVIQAQFSRGHRQIMADGEDNLPIVFNFVMNNVDMTKLRAAHDLLVAKGGWQSFLWTMPTPFDDKQRSWICQRWISPWTGGRTMTLTATFEEVAPGIALIPPDPEPSGETVTTGGEEVTTGGEAVDA